MGIADQCRPVGFNFWYQRHIPRIDNKLLISGAIKDAGTTHLKKQQNQKKGKRKGKKDGAGAPEPVLYNVTTKDLQKFAEVVASSTTTVPRSLLMIAKRAIKLGNEVTSWFLGQGDSANFITVLEQICETLEWKLNQTPGPRSDAKKPPPGPTIEEQPDDADSGAAKLINKFAVLTMEGPQETADAQPTSVESKKLVKVTVVEEEDHAADEAYLGHLFFKTLCLLQDLDNMRKFLSITWSEYWDGKIELMNAAVVTHSTISDGLQDIVYKIAIFNRGISAAPSAEIGLPYNKHMADVAEWCYVPTKILLEAFADVLQAGHHLVTLWLCFASQIFLGVHHIIRRSHLGAFGDLQIAELRIRKTIKEYQELSKTHPPPTFWPKEDDKEIQAISDAVERWIIKDLFQEVRAASGLDRAPSTPEKHALLSQHSILCGLFLFHLNLRMQSIGQQLVTQWYDVQQLAFLHNLVIKSPAHKHLRWPDMDAFIQIHGDAHIFESLQRLELATGISSATNFARDSRNKREWHKPDGKTARVLKPTTTAANLFFSQYVSGFEAADGGIANFDQTLNQLAQQKSKLESSSHKNQQLQKRAANQELNIAQTWSLTRNIDTLHLLAFLKTKLFEEEPLILYNYFCMQKRSIELLRLIRDKELHRFGARELGLAAGGDIEITSRIVLSAADVMRAYLETNGSVACKELRVFCKNKKPVQDDVADDQGGIDNLVDSWLSLEDIMGAEGVASLMTGIPIA
ncbi:hypothetical protein BDW74DRAFT_175108 [Aspergillus multicolor]|uniref:uncharacterized protein n=1 Tax=Aspergillus multicolor TaxID=41759 RepID=UPI003CCE525C